MCTARRVPVHVPHALTPWVIHLSVCANVCKAVSKELPKDLLSMLLRNLSIHLSIMYPAFMPAAYLLLCEFAFNVQQNAASVLSVFCQP